MRETTVAQKLGAEFLGTFVLVFGGAGSAVFAATFMAPNIVAGQSVHLGPRERDRSGMVDDDRGVDEGHGVEVVGGQQRIGDGPDRTVGIVEGDHQWTLG